ncbi:SDR family oxidoreductase [Tunicatimonas pelagia]|uniref:SDR family oxidoreductase n=1 Tax=Tunicatimonas pelagia TaxID=931531 RepID=UPI002665FDF1|nr:SDR family oxidoreductase [Tunicatimonas pelagia]WKN44707.1 SDR family oxidoreductase [Tunicatimonas pelagia]
MVKVLLTGGNGLLGQKLIPLLLSDDEIHTIITSRGKARFAEPYQNYQYFDLDITDRDQVFNVFHLVQPDVVIHTAAMTDVDYCEQHQNECWEINVQGVAHLLRAAEVHNSFFVHLSTDFIFAGDKRHLTEEDTPQPINFYGQAKLQAEALIKQSRVKSAILRTALVYGLVPNMSRSNIVLWVKNSLETRKPISVVDDQYRTPTLVEDLAMGCYLVTKQRAEGVYNISGGEVLTPYQMALEVAKAFGLDASLITKTDSSKFKQTANRPPETGLIVEKARAELGFTPHTFEEGVVTLAKQFSTAS